MERSQAATPPSRSSLRWAILRQAIKGPASPSVNDAEHLLLADVEHHQMSYAQIRTFTVIFDESDPAVLHLGRPHVRAQNILAHPGAVQTIFQQCSLLSSENLHLFLAVQPIRRASNAIRSCHIADHTFKKDLGGHLLPSKHSYCPRNFVSSVYLDHSIERCTKDVSRKTPGGFKLISCCTLNGELHSQKNKCQFGTNELSVCYTLPVDGDKELIMIPVQLDRSTRSSRDRPRQNEADIVRLSLQPHASRNLAGAE
ncbi:hypothetical protein IEQ34_007465 [Dendrobium chrysotoxum]|uniref:Uncharacterized protein n=1 Tax=Dendrobium chrysotoxum TaxID=161865 RepID=A0AAV7H4H9_DENCH|nr:hypothetical protein IEQ34_007465 [Dendrobium chrysotoxum]